MNEEKKPTRHIQISNNIKFKPPYVLHDALVYAYLRSYMNKDTKSCYPSIATLKKDTELNERTIAKSIKSLNNQDLISIRKEGKKNVYTFTDPSLNNFEPFSYEFLSSLKISPKLKGYWILLQQHTFKDDGSGFAKTTYTDYELSELLKIPLRTIQQYNRELKNSGVLSTFPTRVKNNLGEQRYLKLFNLSESQADVITSAPAGQGLIYTGTNCVPFSSSFPKYDTNGEPHPIYKVLTSNLRELTKFEEEDKRRELAEKRAEKKSETAKLAEVSA